MFEFKIKYVFCSVLLYIVRFLLSSVTFDSKLEKLRHDVLSTIDDKMKAVKVDIDLQCAVFETRIVNRG